MESNHPALGIHADARLALQALLETVRGAGGRVGAGAGTRGAGPGAGRIATQQLTLEQGLLASIRAALPARSPSFWDMTILSYWAWSAFDPRGTNTMHSAQGAGGLGYAFPAALGAAVADPTYPVLAVSGDGGALYCIAELATARQYDLNVTWLIVDDGGYGILREYMTDAFGAGDGHGTVATGFRGAGRVVRASRGYGRHRRHWRRTSRRRWRNRARRWWCFRRCCGCSRRRTLG